MNDQNIDNKETGPTRPQEELPKAPELDFEELSGGSDIVYLRLGETRYQLKRTRSGRLVLNK